MKNLIVSITVGLLSGFTVYLLIDYLFERPSKSVKPDNEEEGREEAIERANKMADNFGWDVEEDDDNTIPLKKEQKNH